MGRKKIELDYKIIDSALHYNATLAQLSFLLECKGIKICAKTLGRRIEGDKGITFEEYREKFRGSLKLKLVQKAVQMALTGDRTMLIFCLKNIAGWSDRNEIEQNVKEIAIKIDKKDNLL